METIERLSLTNEEIIDCLRKALKENFIDNLRNRTEIVKLDSKIRGYMGEKGLTNWFAKHNICFSEINHKTDFDSIDLDMVFKTITKEFILEVKTSLIPDCWSNLETCLEKADIKLIKRKEDITNLEGDFHLQIYFNKLRKERDTFLNNLEVDLNGNVEKIAEKMCLEDYEFFFVAWKDKKAIIDYITKLKDEKKDTTWAFGLRTFWKCPIKEFSEKPIDIIKIMERLKNE